MTAPTVPCTEPGCGAPVPVPPIAHHSPVLLDVARRGARCPQHQPDLVIDPDPPRTATLAESWARRVPAPVVGFHGRAPGLADLPPVVDERGGLRATVDAWPGWWRPAGRDVRAIVFADVAGALKTTTAYALMWDLIRGDADPGRHHERFRCATEATLLAPRDHAGRRTVFDPVRDLRGARAVLVDDVGYWREWFGVADRHSAWHALVDHVYCRGLLLVLTTNFATDADLREWIGPAAFSRLVDMSGVPITGGEAPSILRSPTGVDHRLTPPGTS